MEILVSMYAPAAATDSVHYGQRSYEIRDGMIRVPSDVAPELEKMGYTRVVAVKPAEWVRPHGYTGPTGATAGYRWEFHGDGSPWVRPVGFTGATGATGSAVPGPYNATAPSYHP